MTKRKAEAKAERKRYSAAFKQPAWLRAVKEGVSVAARDRGLPRAQRYAWRGKAQQQGQEAEARQLMQSEHARLKREVARLEEENAFLKGGGVLRESAEVKYARITYP